MTYKFGDLVNIYIAFTRAEGGKERPLVCFEHQGEIINGFELTTKEGNAYFKKYRYKIIDWSEAGCDEPSYINLYPTDTKSISVPENISYRGTLTTKDQQGMIMKLQEIQNEFTDN